MNKQRSTAHAGRRIALRLRNAAFKAVLAVLVILVCPITMHAQLTQVTGTVEDSTGEPLIGASVLVQGTKVATVTDIDGNFVLRVQDPAKTVLDISYK